MDQAPLTELELATGAVFGLDATLPSLLDDAVAPPREAFESVIRSALQRTPCGVTFSGGRDSSAALAVAVDLARREGHAMPVPITIRWRGVAGADERDWQHQVIDHLGLDEWVIDELDAEVGFCGPVVEETIRRLGLYYPAHYHTFGFLARHVPGGSLVTGHGGDSLLASWRWRHLHHASGSNPAVQALRIAHALSPLPIRRAIAARRAGPPADWLEPTLRARLARNAATSRASEPRRWAPRLDWLARRRNLLRANVTLHRMGTLHDVQVRDPFFDRGFQAALAAGNPVRGPGDRTQVMRQVFGDVLPEALLARSDKAILSGGYLRDDMREFAETWDGGGFDPSIVVRPESLRARWLSGDADTGLQLQVAFARSRGLTPPASTG